MRYKFYELFKENSDGSLRPKTNLKIGKSSIGQGITFEKGYSFGGVNIFDFEGMDIEAIKKYDQIIIKGFYDTKGKYDNKR